MKTLLFIFFGEFIFPIQNCHVSILNTFNISNLEVEVINVKSLDVKVWDNFGRPIYQIDNLKEGAYTYQIDYLCQDGRYKKKEGDIQLIKNYKH